MGLNAFASASTRATFHIASLHLVTAQPMPVIQNARKLKIGAIERFIIDHAFQK
jgi:hypothetical protein